MRHYFVVGEWVVLRPPIPGLVQTVREVAEVVSKDGAAVRVRFLSDGEERDYLVEELELAAAQP